MAKEDRFGTGSRGGFDRQPDRPRDEFGKQGEFGQRYDRSETERGWEQGREPGRTFSSHQSYGREGEFGGYGAQSYGTETFGSRQDYGTSQPFAPERWNQNEIGRTDFDRGIYNESNRPGRGMRGRGPKGFQRSDDRILEAVCEVLEQDDHIDATNIEVTVISGEVTLSGSVDERTEKRRAEDLTEYVPGVRNVQNQIRVGGGKESADIGTRNRPSSLQGRPGSRNR